MKRYCAAIAVLVSSRAARTRAQRKCIIHDAQSKVTTAPNGNLPRYRISVPDGRNAAWTGCLWRGDLLVLSLTVTSKDGRLGQREKLLIAGGGYVVVMTRIAKKLRYQKP